MVVVPQSEASKMRFNAPLYSSESKDGLKDMDTIQAFCSYSVMVLLMWIEEVSYSLEHAPTTVL